MDSLHIGWIYCRLCLFVFHFLLLVQDTNVRIIANIFLLRIHVSLTMITTTLEDIYVFIAFIHGYPSDVAATEVEISHLLYLYMYCTDDITCFQGFILHSLILHDGHDWSLGSDDFCSKDLLECEN